MEGRPLKSDVTGFGGLVDQAHFLDFNSITWTGVEQSIVTKKGEMADG